MASLASGSLKPGWGMYSIRVPRKPLARVVSAGWSRYERDRSKVPSRFTIERLGLGLRPEVGQSRDASQTLAVSALMRPSPRFVASSIEGPGGGCQDVADRCRLERSLPSLT